MSVFASVTIFDTIQIRKAEQITEYIDVPRHLVPILIGPNGRCIREFQDFHLVKVNLGNRASVVGSSENVKKAVKELCQASSIIPELARKLTSTQ
jgi:hypothetical protein